MNMNNAYSVYSRLAHIFLETKAKGGDLSTHTVAQSMEGEKAKNAEVDRSKESLAKKFNRGWKAKNRAASRSAPR